MAATRPGIAIGTDRELGEEAYELMRRLFPALPQPHGRRGPGDVRDLAGVHPAHSQRGSERHARIATGLFPDEWNIRDAYMAAPMGHESSTSDARTCTSCPTANRCAPGCRSRSCALGCTRCPTGPMSCPTARRTTSGRWGFCLSHRQLLELEPGEYEVVIDATLGPGHLTYAELRLRGTARGRDLDLDVRVPSVAGQ